MLRNRHIGTETMRINIQKWEKWGKENDRDKMEGVETEEKLQRKVGRDKVKRSWHT